MDKHVWSSWTQQEDGVSNQFGNWLNQAFLAPSVHQVMSDFDHCGGGECDDGKVGTSASKNHSEAEKRRRDRINAHLATLRKLVSNSDKMDKATLLGKVVQHVKQLKSEAMELSKVFTFPTEIDKVNIDLHSTVRPCNDVLIKASICCEDRPELFSEIKHAFNSQGLNMVQADMTCLGGRIICNFIFCVTNYTGGDDEITTLKHSLKILLGRIVSSSSWTTSSPNYRIKSKRQRFFCSPSYDTDDRC